MSETDIARPVVAWLRDKLWDVHQEVCIGGGGPRADIVGVQGRLLYVVEVKATLGLAVIEQAMGWRDHAHYVAVAVPRPRRVATGRRFAEQLCRERGIGVLHVGTHHEAVTVEEQPRLSRSRLIPQFVAQLRGVLCEETRSYAAAGNAESRYWSPFRATCEEIRRALGRRGPLTTRELVETIRHHYSSDSSARSTLPKWLDAGKIPGVESDGGRPMRWRLAAKESAA